MKALSGEKHSLTGEKDWEEASKLNRDYSKQLGFQTIRSQYRF